MSKHTFKMENGYTIYAWHLPLEQLNTLTTGFRQSIEE